MSSLDWGVRSLLTLHYESHHIHYSNLRYFNITSIRFNWISSLVAATVQISKIIQEKDSLAIANVLVRQGPVRTAIGRPPSEKKSLKHHRADKSQTGAQPAFWEKTSFNQLQDCPSWGTNDLHKTFPSGLSDIQQYQDSTFQSFWKYYNQCGHLSFVTVNHNILFNRQHNSFSFSGKHRRASLHTYLRAYLLLPHSPFWAD